MLVEMYNEGGNIQEYNMFTQEIPPTYFKSQMNEMNQIDYEKTLKNKYKNI